MTPVFFFLRQAVLGAERLPRVLLPGRLYRGPLVAVGHLPDVRAHAALLPLPAHPAALRRMLRQPHEDSEKRLQVMNGLLKTARVFFYRS